VNDALQPLKAQRAGWGANPSIAMHA